MYRTRVFHAIMYIYPIMVLLALAEYCKYSTSALGAWSPCMVIYFVHTSYRLWKYLSETLILNGVISPIP